MGSELWRRCQKQRRFFSVACLVVGVCGWIVSSKRAVFMVLVWHEFFPFLLYVTEDDEEQRESNVHQLPALSVWMVLLCEVLPSSRGKGAKSLPPPGEQW